MLYKNNLLMYDHQTESLWLHVKHTAVTGPMTGAKLTVLPSSLTTWENWRRVYPDTMALSLDTGYDRNYAADPYADYYKSRRIHFGFASNILQGHNAKELIAGVRHTENSKAYPIDDLRKHGAITDRSGGLESSLSLICRPISFRPSTRRVAPSLIQRTRPMAPIVLLAGSFVFCYPKFRSRAVPVASLLVP